MKDYITDIPQAPRMAYKAIDAIQEKALASCKPARALFVRVHLFIFSNSASITNGITSKHIKINLLYLHCGKIRAISRGQNPDTFAFMNFIHAGIHGVFLQEFL
jgi:hypothetical protein